MLQINTGKFYPTGVGRTNHLRGVLYSNLNLIADRPIRTAAGTLSGTHALRDGSPLIFEMEERIESGERQAGVLVSHGVEPFLTDFAALTSFALNVTISPDAALVRRLVSDGPSLASYKAPKRFLTRCFDDAVWIDPERTETFIGLVEQLLELDRKTFRAAMRAIRTYIAGVRRIQDDLGVAYTLMVTAMESLTQGFDSFETTWSDIDERKRRPVEAALRRASARTAQGVRAAIASTEHASLSRRFRAFTQAHLPLGYFREGPESDGRLAPYELNEALRQAYVLRSRYLHNLEPLPDSLTNPSGNWEITYVNRAATLTLEGLARLTRAVIREFIARGRTTEAEVFDYRREEAGVMYAEWASEYWIAAPLSHASQARKRFEGLLSQVAQNLASAKPLTDLRPMLGDVERLLKRSKAEHRSALLALYGLFNALIPDGLRTPRFQEIMETHAGLIERPSPEFLAAMTLLDQTDTWDVDTHRSMLESYFQRRATPQGLHAPRLIEAGMCLALAERLRCAGEEDEARTWLSRAADLAPTAVALTETDANFDPGRELDWRALLLPPRAADAPS